MYFLVECFLVGGLSVVSRQLVEDGPGPPPLAVVVVGGGLRVQRRRRHRRPAHAVVPLGCIRLPAHLSVPSDDDVVVVIDGRRWWQAAVGNAQGVDASEQRSGRRYVLVTAGKKSRSKQRKSRYLGP